MNNTWKKIASVSIAAMMLTGALAGCGEQTASIDLANPSITVMTKAFQPDSAPADSPVVQKLEEFLGTKLNFIWTPSTSYDEKVTATMGSGEYPHAMLVGSANSSVIQNSRAGTFWEVTEKYKDSATYPNLSQANPMILHNISIDGKTYGIYRSRTLGRAGVTIRKDWLDKVGLQTPTTIDELYEVLKAFKEKDPDGNGQADTFGMIVTNYLDGPLKNVAVWMGAPNKWGLNEESGQLEPDFMAPEFFDALNFFKKCYDEGLINQDMATYSSDKWNEQFLTSKAGVIIDVADRARRIAQNMESVEGAEVDVFGYVKRDAASEAKTLPTTGYDGYYVFPKQAVTTEEDLNFVLGVMDKANEQEALTLCNYGIEGRNFDLDAEGYAVKKDDAALNTEYADLNQFATGIIATEITTKYTTPVAEKVQEVYEDNELYAVPNPAEPYVSDTYSTKGPQLDSIMSEANTKYIVGQISEDDWKAAVERWKTQGGTQVIEEINAQYQADTSIQK